MTQDIYNAPAPLPDSQPVPEKDAVQRPYTPPAKDTRLWSQVKSAVSDMWFWLTAPRWHLVVLCLDKIDEPDMAHRPLKEVERFLRANSRFYLTLTFLTFNDPHPYSGPFGAEQKYFLHWPEIPQKWRDQIPPCSAVLVLYKLNGRNPLQLGSTFALAQGIPVHGKLRPYSSIPTDPFPNPITGEDDYYNNKPYEGYKYHKAQIVSHELNNGIRAKVEVAPYLCAMSVAQSGLPSWEYEAQRIRLDDACYKAIGTNAD